MRRFLILAILWAIPAAAQGPAGYTYCAPENGTCSFTGTMSVAYGAGTSWIYKTLTGGTACNNSVFTDPNVGVVKACYTQVVTPPPPGTGPTPPTPVSITVPPRTITIKWGESDSTVNSFNIYRCVSPQTTACPKLGSTTTMSYVDATVIAGTTYFYFVTSVNASGESSQVPVTGYSSL